MGGESVPTFVEKRFVQKLKAHDPKTFSQFIREFEKPIFNFLFRLIGDRTEAEDLAQEVFIAVFRKISLFREESSLKTWVYKISFNCFRNRRKVIQRTRSRDVHVEEMDSIDCSPKDASIGASPPDRILEGLEMERLIQNAILELDEDHRTIIVLRDVQNLSYQEVCNITGLAEGTVKSRLHRARMTLKERLSSHMR